MKRIVESLAVAIVLASLVSCSSETYKKINPSSAKL